MEEIGIVVGETGSNRFLISLPKDTKMMENEYVVVNVRERDKTREVVGRVSKMGALSHIMVEETSYEALEKIIDSQIDTPKIFAEVETLGYLERSKVKFPRNPPMPGTKVYRASRELLEEFYRVERMPMYIGTLLARDDVKIHIDPRGFLRHLAILAQTGSGKSYTAGVLIEELYEKGATIVIIDPHADYVRMRTDRDGKVVLHRFTVFRNPMSTGRYEGINAEELTVSLKDIEPDEVANIVGIPSNGKRMRGLIQEAMSILEKNEIVSFNDLYNLINEWASENADETHPLPKQFKTQDAVNVLRHLNIARRRGVSNIFSQSTTPLSSIVRKKHISVLDLSGLKNEIQDVLTSVFLTRIYDQNTTGEDIEPVFVIIEEAHNFVPKNKNTKSKDIIKKIAAEGRKFGVFLVVISQRPQKLDQDVLSQANSYIILRLTNREDIKSLSTAAESLSEDLSSLLPTLNPGEAVVVGPIIKVPGIVKIKERRTREGGGDIDIISKLEDANRVVESTPRNTVKEIKDIMMERN